MQSVKVCPPVSSLNSIMTNISCTENGCSSTFKSASNLNMHLIKHHKKKDLTPIPKNCSYEYHCPVDTCVYHVSSSKYFTHMRYLKQHYLKTHALKLFTCDKCSRGFSTLAVRNSHSFTCGVKFTCMECDSVYTSYEALLTHSKRKNHLILMKQEFLNSNKNVIKVQNAKCKVTIIDTGNLLHSKDLKNVSILPKFDSSIVWTPNSMQSSSEEKKSVDIGIQTETLTATQPKSQKKNSPKLSRKRTSAETQTGTSNSRKSRTSTETQTAGDYILKKAMRAAEIPLSAHSKKKKLNTETQTGISTPIKKQANHKYNKNSHNAESKKPIRAVHVQTSLKNQETSLELKLKRKKESAKHMEESHFKESQHATEYPINTFFNQPCNLTNSVEINLPTSEFQVEDIKEKVNGDTSQFILPKILETNSLELKKSKELLEVQDAESLYSLNIDCGLSEVWNDSCTQTSPAVLENNINWEFLEMEPQFLHGSSQTTMNFNDNSFRSAYLNIGIDSLISNQKPSDENRFSSIETQTELDSLLTNDNSNFDQMLYSNMCTQTCEDIFFSELGLNDIETQTVWPNYGDLFVSTETQTSKITETNHTETQTELIRFTEEFS